MGQLPRFNLSHANGRCAAPCSRWPAVAARTQSGGNQKFNPRLDRPLCYSITSSASGTAEIARAINVRHDSTAKSVGWPSS